MVAFCRRSRELAPLQWDQFTGQDGIKKKSPSAASVDRLLL